MAQAITIFLAGIGGVFVGMALLYFAILITQRILQRLERNKEADE